ncbi:DUF4082 domain-containing protein [Streptosporangium canum]|uniref:DUF4082 domain-containing protein n=1 Tax=Streptosporangium canum TaxID=324952 RepID=UPI003788130C
MSDSEHKSGARWWRIPRIALIVSASAAVVIPSLLGAAPPQPPTPKMALLSETTPTSPGPGTPEPVTPSERTPSGESETGGTREEQAESTVDGERGEQVEGAVDGAKDKQGESTTGGAKDKQGESTTGGAREERQKKVKGATARERRLRAACPPTSVICIENSLPGNPPSQWDVLAQSSNIRGYAAQMSVNKGETLQFKVITDATDYRLDIYRLGYYSGLGARLITTLDPSAVLPQAQPACLSDAATGLIDCGNWGVSASWAVPADVVSGVYIANLVREDGTAGTSQIVFVIRDDIRNSDILLQTSDSTWQAYNTYGGNSFYQGQPAGRAFKLSYNRPETGRSRFFRDEYPMVRWIEANGYDVSYTSNVDTASRGAELLEHKMFMSSGHDEYWSNDMWDNAVNARDSGVNLSFFSGNEVFWKTRWESSTDGANVPFRTIVCYKETLANAKIDPSPQWTGTWRDTRFSPPSNGGRPENIIKGTLYRINGVANDAITVPARYGDMRLWRNTSVATLQPGQVAVFPTGTLGYEWDEAPDNGYAPAGLVKFSQTVVNTASLYLLDFGSTYGAGLATHNLTLYKSPSGALVFGSGTIQWSWGLDSYHDRGEGTPTDIRMQQATVNLLADMRCQPASIQPGLVLTTPSTDTAPPTSAITEPVSGGTVPAGTVVPIRGTAADTGGGVVGGVEVSVDGGTRWFQATGRTSWQFFWTTPATAGTVTIKSRAVDDIGNIQGTPTETTVTVAAACTSCTLWSPTTVPAIPSQSDSRAVTLGVKFKANTSGTIQGVRFYKGALNTGTHTGGLWTTDGQLLASATFTGEGASGWQQVSFSAPVAIKADTTYIASYHTTSGFFSVTKSYFTSQYVNGPLTALADGASGGNGVYTYGATNTFPTSTFQASNYWVDVVFTPSSSLWDSTATGPQSRDSQAVTLGVKFKANTTGIIQGIRFYKGPQNTGTHTGSLWTSGGTLLATATFTNESASGWQQVNFSAPVAIKADTTYIASYHTTSGFFSVTKPYFTSQYVNGPLTALADGASGGNGVYTYGATSAFPTTTYQASNYWVDVVFTPSNSLWDSTVTPATQSADPRAITVGVKFKANVSGTIQGIRFYKGPQNTGTHTASLWTTDGQLISTAISAAESASGWQQENFPAPVAIKANTTYVVSYHTTSGFFSVTKPYFGNQYVNGPLTALADGAGGGNGVYTYGPASAFPDNSYQASNYWVDVVFVP